MLYVPTLSASLSPSGRAKNCWAMAKVSSTRCCGTPWLATTRKPGVLAGAGDRTRKRRCRPRLAGEVGADVEHRDTTVIRRLDLGGIETHLMSHNAAVSYARSVSSMRTMRAWACGERTIDAYA